METRWLIEWLLFLRFIGYVENTEPDTCNNLSNGVHRFGVNCKYMCHCHNDETCNFRTGYCTNGCTSGWFGPACQIRDLPTYYTGIITRHSSTAGEHSDYYSKKAVDENITTCSYTNYANLSESEPWWKVWLPGSEIITEMRILTNDVGKTYFDKFTITVEHVPKDRNIEPYFPPDSEVCYQQRVQTAQDKEIHVVCDKPLHGNQVRIQLNNAHSQLMLCDVKIHGGRNFAFQKNAAANSPSDEAKHSLEKAVNGSVKADDWSKDCFLSKKGTGVWFNVDLEVTVNLTRIVLTRRGSDTTNPYQIQTSRDNITWITVHTDNGKPATVYVNTQVSTRYLRIYRPTTDEENAICELQAFGECANGYCGYDCSDECHCKSTEDRLTGSCLAGCEGRLTGPNDTCVQECDEYSWGKNCSQKCGTGSCYNSEPCDVVTGKCTSGCADGYKQTDLCNTECDAGTYGRDCVHNCSDNCNHGHCFKSNGTCAEGCLPGFTGDICDKQCDNGTYGLNCSNVCNDNCNSTCNAEDGTCSKCLSGWQGPHCATEYEQTSEFGSSLIAGIVGCVVAVALVVVAVILVVVYCHMRHARSSNHTTDNKTVHKDVGRTEENNIAIRDDSQYASSKLLKQDVVYVNTNETSKEPSTHEEYYNVCLVSRRTPHAVSLTDILAYVRERLSNGDLVKQFEELPYGLQQKFATKAATSSENVGKNRYNNIHPYDHCRVVLKQLDTDATCDYINASHIKGYQKENAYIAAQGPTNQTLNEFWRLIWEKDVHIIAMVTNLIENTKTKCVQYWPPVGESVQYGNITVITEIENIFADFDVRRFKVSQNGESEKREMIHFGYTAWPDKGVPNTTTSLLQFWHMVRKNNAIKSQPWLVHCSAGVGRTGTFIALDILYDQGHDTGYVDVYQCIKDLRDQRVNMVQVKEQYQYLHLIVLDALVLPSHPVSMEEFEFYYTKQLEIDQGSESEKLLLQYQSLSEMISVQDVIPNEDPDSTIDIYSCAKDESNIDKNRFSTILAQNEYRPFLCTPVKETTNYINAVYMPSYCDSHGFIITQTPLPITAVDACRLIVEQEVQVIVTFDEGNDSENVGTYLPVADTIELGPFAVSFVSEEDKTGYIVRKHDLLYNSKVYKLTQIIYKAWSPSSLYPDDPIHMLSFLHDVDCLQRLTENKPLIAQCMNGAERSGLLVVLMNIIEYARIDGAVSIPNVIRYLRTRRSDIVPNYEQYKFCHDVFLCYTQSESKYANM